MTRRADMRTMLSRRGAPIWMVVLSILVAAVAGAVPRSTSDVATGASPKFPASYGVARDQGWLGTWMAASLPAQVRARHIGEIERAERWELALDGAIETWARIKATLATKFETLRSAH